MTCHVPISQTNVIIKKDLDVLHFLFKYSKKIKQIIKNLSVNDSASKMQFVTSISLILLHFVILRYMELRDGININILNWILNILILKISILVKTGRMRGHFVVILILIKQYKIQHFTLHSFQNIQYLKFILISMQYYIMKIQLLSYLCFYQHGNFLKLILLKFQYNYVYNLN